jgi:hypothetical protein
VGPKGGGRAEEEGPSSGGGHLYYSLGTLIPKLLLPGDTATLPVLIQEDEQGSAMKLKLEMQMFRKTKDGYTNPVRNV